MKTGPWLVFFIAVSTFIVSCGQPGGGNKSNSDVVGNSVTSETLQSTASGSTQADSYITENKSFLTNGDLSNSEKGLTMLNHFNQEHKFSGYYVYGSASSQIRGEYVSVEFVSYGGSTYTYLDLRSSRGNLWQGFSATATSELSIGLYKLNVHADPNCLIVRNIVNNNQGIVCKE